ncbi:MAG TPA: hypothetical protein PLR25_19045, partial [Planctomycetaceae bacterium]|nr:hypothetical protein [Planctomycetaceae bacterium]
SIHGHDDVIPVNHNTLQLSMARKNRLTASRRRRRIHSSGSRLRLAVQLKLNSRLRLAVQLKLNSMDAYF